MFWTKGPEFEPSVFRLLFDVNAEKELRLNNVFH